MALSNILLLSLILIISSSCQTHNFANLKVVSDLLPEHCFLQDSDYIEADPVYSLPRCIPFKENPAPGEIGVCTRYHRIELVYKPSCTKSGQFNSKQCKGERATGRCFCFDANGRRIFGQQWWNKADDMTCACSRKKADMADSLYFNSLHCDGVGNFEPLQCDVISGQCWCVDQKTGDLTSTIVPQKAMTKLPCYASLNVGNGYLRQCESKKYAQSRIIHELILHGTNAHFTEFLCDDDGSFGAYNIVGGSAYCTWRDNSVIGSWQTGNNHTGVNCNCARDTNFFAEAGKNQIQRCTSNGNYDEFQKIGSNTYCVDLAGYRKSWPSDAQIVPTNCSEFHAYE